MSGRKRGPGRAGAGHGRTSPAWRAWQLSAVTLGALSLAGYWTLTSTAGDARATLAATPGAAPSFTVLLAGRDIAYCYYRTPCKDQNSERARSETRTDTVMLMKVDGTNVRILTVPRDTQVSEPGGGLYAGSKINAAYAVGGPRELARQVEAITGERVDYYAVVHTTYVEDVIDALGGLSVNVPARIDFDDYAAGLHLHLDEGPQHLMGEEAVAYLRMRKGVGDDYGRMDHQKAAIAQLVGKLRTPAGVTALPSLLGGFREGVETNADPALLQRMIPYLGEYKLGFATLPTTEIPGSSNLLPDREALMRVWNPLGAPTLVSERKATLRVFDASGAQVGGKLAEMLRRRGFPVAGVTELPASGESSQVFTLNEVAGAAQVAAWLNLPSLQGLRFPVEGGEVGVYLGRDAVDRFSELTRLNVASADDVESE